MERSSNLYLCTFKQYILYKIYIKYFLICKFCLVHFAVIQVLFLFLYRGFLEKRNVCFATENIIQSCYWSSSSEDPSNTYCHHCFDVVLSTSMNMRLSFQPELNAKTMSIKIDNGLSFNGDSKLRFNDLI